jgi:hypothetical protein
MVVFTVLELADPRICEHVRSNINKYKGLRNKKTLACLHYCLLWAFSQALYRREERKAFLLLLAGCARTKPNTHLWLGEHSGSRWREAGVAASVTNTNSEPVRSAGC